ncbi:MULTISPECIES: hypothetical protein [unclassified Pseudoclavibacter]|uniref:hypothetical protein n=1 Tax=unclassified Pseudoclavibacter TaxID=2615177 RepID=UPI0012F11C68|nr:MULTISPECIES: hypothetical protein [unclassified Pseudoclavibacter]VXB91634.1 conserved hypothetical protein [Pseudoclavibacter sp. 8L]
MSNRPIAQLPGAARMLCLSRRSGEICTRRAGHAGLHNRTGSSLLWSDIDADAPRCPASGSPAVPAPRLPDGYPHGRALCGVCFAFVTLDDGALSAHDSWRGDESREEADQRREWMNTHGW